MTERDATTTDSSLPPADPGGRLLGLDHGSRRVGVAVSDPTGTIASARGHIAYKSLDQLLDRIRAVLEDEAENGAIVGIVIGDPRHMSGEPSEGTEQVIQLRERLMQSFELPVWCWDERLTTVAAEAVLTETGVRGRRRRQKVDAMAAAFILQSFLEAIRARSEAAAMRARQDAPGEDEHDAE